MLQEIKSSLKTKLSSGKSMLFSLIGTQESNPETYLSILRGKMFFVFGCARSGTTSLCRIIDTASNTECLMEPNPNFNVESRNHLDGTLEEPYKCLMRVITKRAVPVVKGKKLYGEKNVTLFAFIEEVYELFECKFVFVVRDGRAVVQSMHNWHNELFGNFYRECKDEGDLSPEAKRLISDLPRELDTADFSRPRPRPGDPYYEKWTTMSRHEMLSWYWNFVNNYVLDKFESVPAKDKIIIDYTNPNVIDVERVFDFLSLEGFDSNTVEGMLKGKINSLADRTGDLHPRRDWRDWTDDEFSSFTEIAGPAMRKLGYWIENAPNLARYTSDFGEYWKKGTDIEFYRHIYEDRLPQHEAFMDLVRERWDDIESVCEVGCGRGIGYTDFFKDKQYTGIDISADNIEWCRQNYNNPKHKWIVADFIKNPPEDKFDLVFCQGTIENIYDMDALVEKMSDCCKKFLYITAFKGYFPELKEHVYEWNPVCKCFENKLSLLRTETLLDELGFWDIKIFPQKTKKQDIEFETVIFAKR